MDSQLEGNVKLDSPANQTFHESVQSGVTQPLKKEIESRLMDQLQPLISNEISTIIERLSRAVPVQINQKPTNQLQAGISHAEDNIFDGQYEGKGDIQQKVATTSESF